MPRLELYFHADDDTEAIALAVGDIINSEGCQMPHALPRPLRAFALVVAPGHASSLPGCFVASLSRALLSPAV
jgi:hypothetical protein